nr:MAG: hypothetical protein [uncultured archaeon]
MGIRIKKLNVLIDTFDYYPVYTANIIGKSEVIEYEAQNPFPITKYYNRAMLINDMQHDNNGGILTFNDNITDEQINWIETFLNEVI